MNYRIQQAGPNIYEGLFGLLGTIMGNNARQRQDAKMYTDVADYTQKLDNLDYGGQTSIEDLASPSNPNSNYTGSKVAPNALTSLLPKDITNFTPTPFGQGLVNGGLIQQQPAQQPTLDQSFNSMMGKYSKENNPAKVTTSEPKNLDQQVKMIRSQIPLAMKELIAKGYNPKEVLPLLQQASNDKIAEHTSTYQQKQVEDLYQGFITEENPNKKAMYAARLKQSGYDVTTPYKEFAPTYQSENINTGGQQLGLSFNPKTGKYEQQFIVDNTVSPDAQLSANARLQAAAMRGSGASGGGGSRSSGGSGGSGTSRQTTEKPDGPGTKNGKRLDPLEKAKYAELYNQKLEDIWDSATPEIRAQKIRANRQELDELGYYMDRNVQNDLEFITGG